MSKFEQKVFILTDVDVRDAPNRIIVVPAGMVRSTKGDFIVDESSYEDIKQYFHERQLDIVIDYEHQTLTGNEAPAAGWITGLTWEDGIGVIGEVQWTDKAKGYLESREYRYLSPVVLVNKDNRKAVRLHSAALTNTPAITGMTAIVNSERMMDMELAKLLIEALGLPEDTSEEQLIEAIKSMKGELNEVLVANSDIKTMLGLDKDSKNEDAKGIIIALKNQEGTNVSKEELLQLKNEDAERIVEQALEQGKLIPAQKRWAIQYVLSDKKGFNDFIEKQPEIFPMQKIQNGPEKKSATLDEQEMMVCKSLGLTEEDFKKSKNE